MREGRIKKHYEEVEIIAGAPCSEKINELIRLSAIVRLIDVHMALGISAVLELSLELAIIDIIK